MTNSSTFVSGVFHYCDRWCQRCAFANHCPRRPDLKAFEDVCTEGRPLVEVWLLDRDWDPGWPEGFPSWMSPSERHAFEDVLGRRDPPLADEEFDRLQSSVDEKTRRVLSHPLTRAGAAYEQVVRDEIEPLCDQIYPTGKWREDHAVEAIARYAVRIGAIAARAAAGLVGGVSGDDPHEQGLKDVQSDANGCAKLLHLLLRESRDSWQLLAGHECVVELEGQMLWHIDGMDDLVKEYFPRAAEFMRPGFDDPV